MQELYEMGEPLNRLERRIYEAMRMTEATGLESIHRHMQEELEELSLMLGILKGFTVLLEQCDNDHGPDDMDMWFSKMMGLNNTLHQAFGDRLQNVDVVFVDQSAIFKAPPTQQ